VLVARRRNTINPQLPKVEAIEFYVTEAVEMQIELGENLLEIVYSDISVDTDNETCPRCNYLLTDDDVVKGWTPSDSQRLHYLLHELPPTLRTTFPCAERLTHIYRI
jgi:hypothetical protein